MKIVNLLPAQKMVAKLITCSFVDMKPHEIHLEFMKATLVGSYAMCVNPVIHERLGIEMKRRNSTGEMYHSMVAMETANKALEMYLDRWPELKEKN